MKIRNLLIKNQTKRNTVSSENNHFYLYDVIDTYWGVNAEEIRRFLDSQDGEVHIHINSPGGCCFEGRTIASLIRAYKNKVICHIDGLAASAASTVAVACDEVVMAKGSMLMIHNAWTVAMGNKAELTETIGLLDKIDLCIKADFVEKTGLEESVITEMMDAETWFTADEAVEKGFADRIDDEKSKADTSNFALDCYENTPENLKSSADDYRQKKAVNERRLKLFEFA